MSLEEFKKRSQNNTETTLQDKSDNKCMNLLAQSAYKAQLGINSIKDAINTNAEVQLEILKALSRIADALDKANNEEKVKKE